MPQPTIPPEPDLETVLLSLQAYVDRVAAEIHDPETTDARRQYLREEKLRPLFNDVKELLP